MNIATIKKGKYELNDSLELIVEETMQFSLGENYLLTGENGVGKSSFVSHLLIPHLIPRAKNSFLLFYTSQDITIQYYMIKSYYKGLKGEKRNISSIRDALYLIKEKYVTFDAFPTKNIVFVLDEIDQYVQLNKFLQDLNKENYSTFLITHNKHTIETVMQFREVLFQRESSTQSKVWINT